MIADPRPFQELIKQRCGLMFEGAAEANLHGALTTRRAALGGTTASAYYARLVADADEFHELVTLLTINETYFFREPQQIALLTDKLVPRLLSRRSGDRPVRILSAGCSTGEEPYSVAIALLEKYGDCAQRLFDIIAGDIDQQALAKARAGRYGDFSFRALPPDLRERYFTAAGAHIHQLAPQVRRMVRFHHLNLLDSDIPAELGGADIVLFRNVSIYFDAATRTAIQRNLGRLMADDGVLIVGAAETLANDLGVFRQVEEDGLFHFVKGEPPAPAAPRPRTVFPPPPPVPKPRQAPRPSPAPAPVAAAPDLGSAMALAREERYGDALAALEPVLQRWPDHQDAMVLHAFLCLQLRRVAQAEAIAARVLEQDEWRTEAMVVQGFAARSRGDAAAAIRWFKQAAYVRHDCWVAHYYLADAYRADARPDLARRAYRTALAQMNGRPDADGGLSLPLGLPLAEVRLLCERHCTGEG